ncbi:hypothetical protein [Candidatus Nitrososphaera evergladensis]|nr:hypothetical protein [Candidatus Nitrososphaera evergladensis]
MAAGEPSREKLPSAAWAATIPVAAGLATGILFVLIFSVYATGSQDARPRDREITWYNDNGEIACGQPIEIVKARAPFAVPLPTALPAGYSLQYADYSGVKEVFMEFYNSTICGGDGPKSLHDGTIEIRIDPFSERIAGTNAAERIDGSQYTEGRFQTLQNAGSIDARKYAFSDGNRHAVGYNAGTGTSVAVDENNVTIHAEQYDYPSSLWVVDDEKDIIYRLEAHMPIDELARIAESMK